MNLQDMGKWKDCTSYSRGDGGSPPRTWGIRIGHLRLVVTRRHGFEGWWVQSEIHALQQLSSASIEDAKREALEIAGFAIQEMLEVWMATRAEIPK